MFLSIENYLIKKQKEKKRNLNIKKSISTQQEESSKTSFLVANRDEQVRIENQSIIIFMIIHIQFQNHLEKTRDYDNFYDNSRSTSKSYKENSNYDNLYDNSQIQSHLNKKTTE
jgi:hypothetical protein